RGGELRVVPLDLFLGRLVNGKVVGRPLPRGAGHGLLDRRNGFVRGRRANGFVRGRRANGFVRGRRRNGFVRGRRRTGLVRGRGAMGFVRSRGRGCGDGGRGRSGLPGLFLVPSPPRLAWVLEHLEPAQGGVASPVTGKDVTGEPASFGADIHACSLGLECP